MESIQKHLKSVRVPNANSRVYKDECAYSFHTQRHPGGLNVCLYDWIGVGPKYVQLHRKKTGHSLYLNIRQVKKEKPIEETKTSSEEPPLKKPTILGIGVDGGFAAEAANTEYEEQTAIFNAETSELIPLPNPNIPDLVSLCVKGILEATSASRQDDIKAWVAEKHVASKFTENLLQLEDRPKIPASGWRCAVPDCDRNTENLWLNLTDGYIGCGRKNFDGTGGNGHAGEHYAQTQYPLAVKLGTITPEGTADVYSYPEDDMVEDPLLAKHLAHFGINFSEMKKTEKTLAEMELDANLNYEFARIQEKGKKLRNLFGPGLTGIENLGSSCYMSSVLQVLFSIPSFEERFYKNWEHILNNSTKEPVTDLELQLAKAAHGLLSGDYSVPEEAPKEPETEEEKEKQKAEGIEADQIGIAPRLLRSLVGQGHPEFSTMRQQDALEYFQHLLTIIDRMEHAGGNAGRSPTQTFTFKLEDRLLDTASGMVRYSTRTDNVLSLNVPLDKATNLEAVTAYNERVKVSGKPRDNNEIVRAKIPFQACIDNFIEPEVVPQFTSPVTKQATTAVKTTLFASFPDVLAVQLKRYVAGENWVPQKLDVLVDVPDFIDLEVYRSKGVQPGEQLLPEDDKNAKGSSDPVPDEAIVKQLMDMGFPRIRCEKAALNTNNQGADPAMEWLFSHMEDADIDTPIPKKEKPQEVTVDEGSVETVSGMGFSKPQAIKALKACNGSVERAIDWLFNHPEDTMDTTEDNSKSASGGSSPSQQVRDGPGKYRLFGVISPIWSPPPSGH
eukprot:TRINITY_DN7397_c0_g1_i1.p1 TRINITY_DN7397_c0_g1~~TRINITY_DN7397_c0_g1_i1.p1  ORF type:complete len:784 (+),score=202.72 TRINITY_DN7397_c0_g1_i1:173-2524(+)